jgi:type IV secretory pathway protease TraF
MARVEGGPAARWATRSLLAAAFVVAWVVVQAVIPLVVLGQPRPSRFGWQMYTTTTDLPHVSLRMTDGRVVPIDVGASIARDRAEAGYLDALILALCGRGGAAAVIVESDDGDRVQKCP